MERILLVEDTKSVIDLVNTALTGQGYKVSIATTGTQALNIAPKLQPSLILLDILMPEMDGYETCNALKENNQTKDIPVIFLSALTKTFDKVKAFQLGGVDYVSKPIETDELLARVRTHLTISRLQNELKEANESLEGKVKLRTAELQEANLQLQSTISELFEKSKALKESEERYKYITESITDYIYKVYYEDNKPVKTVHSNTCKAILGYSARELNQNSYLWYDIIYPVDKQKVMEFLDNFPANKNNTLEHRIIRKDGQMIWISNTLLAYHDENGNLVAYDGIIKDITGRKELEQKILTNTIETEEKERQRFAQELHDGIGPILSTIKMYIQWLLEPETKADINKILPKVHSIVNEAHESIRQISFNLSPHILQNFGLLAALEAFTNKVKESSSIAIDLVFSSFIALEKHKEVIIYRILTECIANTVKHAEASCISIEFFEQEKKLMICFYDNGKGFNFDEIKQTGLGLFNMKSRLQSINGKLSIESSIGKGTKILIELSK